MLKIDHFCSAAKLKFYDNFLKGQAILRQILTDLKMDFHVSLGFLGLVFAIDPMYILLICSEVGVGEVLR